MREQTVLEQARHVHKEIAQIQDEAERSEWQLRVKEDHDEEVQAAQPHERVMSS